MTSPPRLLGRDGIERLRTALAREFSAEAIGAALGPDGGRALTRGDLDGVRRALRNVQTPTATLIRMFLLGEAVVDTLAADALSPLRLSTLHPGGLLEAAGTEVRAAFDVRPYGEADLDAGTPHAAAWWVVSDFGADVRPGPLRTDHVLGIGAAALTLAQATIRRPVASAVDLGTGCGIQALHLAGHAAAVTATDLSERALRCAATTAALSGQAWDLRAGSLLAPVAGRRFDAIVTNPPFVISPPAERGDAGYIYRDSGLASDALTAQLITTLPAALTERGVAQLLANWIIPANADWTQRLQPWLAASGCDAWVWQREAADPIDYVRLWLHDAGEQPGTARWQRRYTAWLDWFAAQKVAGIGMGLITLWASGHGEVLVCDDVPQQVRQPVGAVLPDWYERQRWLLAHAEPDRFGAARLLVAADVGLRRDLVPAADGWRSVAAELRQGGGMRWKVEIDEAIAALVAGSDGSNTVAELCAVLAATFGAGTDEVLAAALPALGDLVGRGFLLPESLAGPYAGGGG